MEPAPAPAPAPTPAPAPAPAPSSQLVEAQPLREDGLEFLSDTLGASTATCLWRRKSRMMAGERHDARYGGHGEPEEGVE